MNGSHRFTSDNQTKINYTEISVTVYRTVTMYEGSSIYMGLNYCSRVKQGNLLPVRVSEKFESTVCCFSIRPTSYTGFGFHKGPLNVDT